MSLLLWFLLSLAQILTLLECDVYFQYDDGTKVPLDYPADLDYLNVRQWRKLWCIFCENNKKQHGRLIIEPKYYRPF